MILKLKTIQSKLAFGFALGPIILAIIGWIAYTNTTHLVERHEARRHSYEALQQIELERARLTDAETGQRGVLRTGDERYLEPDRAATTSAATTITRLTELARDNPRQQARIQALSGLVRQKLDELAETVTLRRDKGPDAALEIVRTDRGKKVMDD